MNDTDTLLRQLRRNSVRVERAKSGHWKIYDRQGHMVTTLAASPHGRSSVGRARSALQKLGLL